MMNLYLIYSLAIVGSLVILYHIWKLISVFKLYFLKSAFDYKKYGAGSGAWAIVTGSSDGIGKEFAINLGKKGFNIVLISRSESKLREVASTINKECPNIQTKIISFDFATTTDYRPIEQALNGLDISVLVNNVGTNVEYPKYFLEENITVWKDIIEVNCTATIKISYIVLPFLVKRGSGLVLNISSISGVLPAPLLSVYSASKAFLISWSKCVHAEYKNKGINIECVTPAFVVSNMSKRKYASLSIPLPTTFTKSVLNAVGVNWCYAGFWVHEMMLFALQFIPEYFAVAKNKSFHDDIKRRAIAKKKST